MKREKVNYTIQSVSHALDILESFTKTEDELGVTELSKRLGLHKNNVFRLLATLEHRTESCYRKLPTRREDSPNWFYLYRAA